MPSWLHMLQQGTTRLEGVSLLQLASHDDARGSLTEVFRQSWVQSLKPVQWNYVRSAAGVLRGVHAHFRHTDYLVVLEGAALIGLKDLRHGSSTRGCADLVELGGRELRSLVIPPGVAHGFYFPGPAAFVYGVTHYWEHEDELGCRWDDPALGIPWPFTTALISEKDQALPPLAELESQMAERLAQTQRARGA